MTCDEERNHFPIYVLYLALNMKILFFYSKIHLLWRMRVRDEGMEMGSGGGSETESVTKQKTN